VSPCSVSRAHNSKPTKLFALTWLDLRNRQLHRVAPALDETCQNPINQLARTDWLHQKLTLSNGEREYLWNRRALSRSDLPAYIYTIYLRPSHHYGQYTISLLGSRRDNWNGLQLGSRQLYNLLRHFQSGISRLNATQRKRPDLQVHFAGLHPNNEFQTKSSVVASTSPTQCRLSQTKTLPTTDKTRQR
jgi:hypothetical protein